MTKNTIKLGLIGLGRMGQNHLRVLSILKSVDLKFVYDYDFKKAQELANNHDTNAYENLDEAFNQELDAIVICSPTSTHAEYIEKAASFVKNIFVEKPITATLDEAKKVSKIVNDNNINLQVGFIERFNPAVAQLKNILDSTKKVMSIDFTRTNKLSRITDVDVITDLMVHDVDLALHLNGDVEKVSANGVIRNDLIVFSSAILTHKNGKFSRIQASCVTEKKMRKIEATCEDLFVDCDLLKKEITVIKQSETFQEDGKPYKITSTHENIEVKQQEALLLELQSFISVCQGETVTINPTANDGVNAIEICDKIQSEIYK